MPVVNTTQNFATGDTVTSTSLNNIMDQSVFVTGAVVAGDGLTVTAGGQMTIENLKVTGGKIGDLEISTAKIANDAITTAKIVNDAITTAKIANLNVTPEKLSQKITSGTSQSATGTSIDFTGIPSWVKKVTVMLNGVSTTGNSYFLIQLGDAGGVESTSYVSVHTVAASTVDTASNTSGFLASGGNNTRFYYGAMQIFLNASNNWAATGMFNDGLSNTYSSSGAKTLSDTLDRIRVTTVIGTDTFDAGSINIIYE